MLAGGNETETDGSLQADEYKVNIDGLNASQIEQVTVSSDAGDQYQDTITNTANGAESSRFGVVVDNDGQALTTRNKRRFLRLRRGAVALVAPKRGDIQVRGLRKSWDFGGCRSRRVESGSSGVSLGRAWLPSGLDEKGVLSA